MIASITQTTAPGATADPKGSRSPTSPDPSTPLATSPLATSPLPPHVSEPDLLADFLAAELPLLALCDHHAIDLDDLLRWLDHPRTRFHPHPAHRP